MSAPSNRWSGIGLAFGGGGRPGWLVGGGSDGSTPIGPRDDIRFRGKTRDFFALSIVTQARFLLGVKETAPDSCGLPPLADPALVIDLHRLAKGGDLLLEPRQGPEGRGLVLSEDSRPEG